VSDTLPAQRLNSYQRVQVRVPPSSETYLFKRIVVSKKVGLMKKPGAILPFVVRIH
jgi:hypothetical protein